MPAAVVPENEDARLRALRALNVLDSLPEYEFDALVRVAALVCGVPISLVSLVDHDRQWFKANVGLEGVTETPRTQAFCAHAILDDSLLEVVDAKEDPRFADNPLVTEAPHIRFYAGAPIKTGDGLAIGTLCVIDYQPRQLTQTQQVILLNLAKVVTKALESRLAAQSFAHSEARFRALSDGSPLGVFACDVFGNYTYTNEKWREIYGLSLEDSVERGWRLKPHSDDREKVNAEWQRAVTHKLPFDMESRIVLSDGTIRHIRAIARPVVTHDETGVTYVGSVEDATERIRDRLELADQRQRLAWTLEATGAGTWEWNLQTGEMRLNEQWARIVGQSLSALAPISVMTWVGLTHPSDLLLSRARLNDYLAGKAALFECELRMRHADGYWVWVLDRGGVLTYTADGKPEWMFGTLVDITTLKQQQEALKKSEWLLNRVGEVAGVGGWEYELRSGQVVWTDQTSRIHGVEPGYQPELNKAIEFYAPEARLVIQDVLDRAARTGEGWDLELPLIRADGRRIWVRTVGNVENEDGIPARMIGALQDITERVQQHQALQKLVAEVASQHELLRVTLHSIGDAVLTTDSHGLVEWLNPVAERLTGWSSIDARGKPSSQVFHVLSQDTRMPVQSPIDICLQEGTIAGLAENTLLVSLNGQEYGIEDSAAPIRSLQGDLLGVVLVFHDVTEQRRITGELTRRAKHDALIGLVNRTEFEVRLSRVLGRSQEEGALHSLMFIDLDQFKLVNDACGHAIGDLLLQQVSKLLSDTIRTRDTLARLGGDEFAVLLEHCTVEQAQRVGKLICERMDRYRLVHDGRRFRVGASIGLVPVDGRWPTVAALMRAADSACYVAKEAGRNRVHTWIESDQALTARHGEIQWATRLEHALDEDRFVLFAQRILPIGSHSDHIHAEVLLRLVDADGTVSQPGSFLPAAERFHLSARIDRWVLHHCIQWMHSLESLSSIQTLCINLSGQSIGDKAFHRHALELLTQAGPEICQRICLEITETAAITHMVDASQFVKAVHELGIRVALDDFGAGASSFGYLKSLKVDLLKIDGQFIRDLLEDPLDDVAVRCFVDVARVVGVKTVAEFVDRPEVLARLEALGVHYAQGYLHHKPEPIERLVG